MCARLYAGIRIYELRSFDCTAAEVFLQGQWLRTWESKCQPSSLLLIGAVMAAQKQHNTAALASTILCIIALAHVSTLSSTKHLVLGLIVKQPAGLRRFMIRDFETLLMGSLTAAGPKNRFPWD